MRRALFVPIVLATLSVVVASLMSAVEAGKGQGKQAPIPATLQEAVEALASPDPLQRARATCTLARMKGEAASAVPLLINLLADDAPIAQFKCNKKGEDWRHNDHTSPGREAAKTLPRIGGPAVDALVSALERGNPVTRAHAAFAMQMVHDDRVVQPLLTALDDTAWQVRQEATWALSSKDDPRVVPGLRKALEDPDPRVREKAAWSLGIRGTDETVEPLIVALADSDAGIRTQAAWALGITGDSRAVEPLNAALEDESGSVREQAAWALGVLGDARAVEPLIAALTDTNPEVRKQAAWALGIIGDPKAGDALRDLSNRKGESKAAKAAALKALDHVGAANVPIEGTRTLNAESSALSGQKLLLETERGSFRIRATDTDRVHVETTFTCYQGRIPCDRLLASLALGFRQSGDEIELTIEGPSNKKERKSARRQLAAETSITVPSSLPLAIRLKVGEVDIELPQKAVSRIELLSDMGRPELEGQDIRSETRYSDRGDHGHEVEWSGGSGGADITVEVGVGSISARLTG